MATAPPRYASRCRSSAPRLSPAHRSRARASGTLCLRSSSWTSHRDLIGEHRAIVGIIAAEEIILTHGLRTGCAVARQLDIELAVRGRPDHPNWIFLRELEVDEESRVEDLQRQLFGLDRRLQRQGEMQDEQAILVFEEVVDRLLKLALLPIRLGKGEVGEL